MREVGTDFLNLCDETSSRTFSLVLSYCLIEKFCILKFEKLQISYIHLVVLHFLNQLCFITDFTIEPNFNGFVTVFLSAVFFAYFLNRIKFALFF